MRRRDRPWLALLVALPLLVHLPELSGLVSSDPLLLMSGLGVGVSGGLLPGQPGWIDGNAGVTVQALGRLVARDWAHGIVPWWDPYAGVGVPLAGEYQPAAFFLPWVLLLGLPNGVLLLKLALQIVAGLSGWGLGRRLGFARPVAALAGVMLAFDGSFAWASDAPIQPMAFLPLILLGIERARSGGWTVLGLGLGWSLLAGFPETAFLDGLLAAGWALLRLAEAGGHRVRLSIALGLGAAVGLGLAAPQLVAFLDLLPDAYVGAHGGTMQVPLPPAGFALWLMPWLYGPMFSAGQSDLWYRLGGYLGAAPVLLALLGLAGRRERRLRLLLLGWVVLVAGKSAGVAPVAWLADRVPLLAHAVVSRYGTASLALAVILLAGFALDDWRRGGRGVAPRRLGAALAGLGLLLMVAMVVARPVEGAVWQLPGGRLAMALSLLLLLAVTAGLAWLLLRAPGRRAVGGVVAIAAVEALLLFAVPLLSARTQGRLDAGTLGYLRGHLGLQRFTTLGSAFAPNYGSYFRLASINHNLVPVPRAWTDHLRAAIDPGVEPVQFYGADAGSLDGIERRAAALRAHLPALEALGVAYLLQDHGQDRLGVPALPEQRRVDAGGQVLGPGGRLAADYPAGSVPGLAVARLSLPVGTFMGRSRGQLRATLCSVGTCATGVATLDGAIDNAPLQLVLDRPLALHADRPLSLLLDHPAGTPVAIWLWHRAEGGPDLPRLSVASADMPVLVHSGEAADIYALPHPAPYAEASGPCRLRILDRTRMQAACDGPGTLLRRELFLPGWQARIDGRWRPVLQAGPLFQSIALAPGRSLVRFAYAPPHAWLGWTGLALALLLLLGRTSGTLLPGSRIMYDPAKEAGPAGTGPGPWRLRGARRCWNKPGRS